MQTVVSFGTTRTRNSALECSNFARFLHFCEKVDKQLCGNAQAIQPKANRWLARQTTNQPFHIKPWGLSALRIKFGLCIAARP